MPDLKLITIFCVFFSILIIIIYTYYARKQERAKNKNDVQKNNHYERKLLIIVLIVSILFALPGTINDIKSLIEDWINQKKISSVYKFSSGIFDIDYSRREEFNLKPGKYILKVSELDKKIKLEISTNDKIIFSDIVSNIEKEINIETEANYNVCISYYEGPTKYIVGLQATDNESQSYELCDGLVSINNPMIYKCRLNPGQYLLSISELDNDINLEISNKQNIIFSSIVSNSTQNINIENKDNYDIYIRYNDGFTKYKLELVGM